MKFKFLALKLYQFFKAMAFLLLAVVFVFLTAWTYCYGLHFFYLMLVVLIGASLLYYRKRQIKPVFYALLLGLMLFGLAIPYNLKQYNKNGAAMQRKINSKNHLSFREKCGVYGNLLMLTVVEFIPFREASKMNFEMLFPNNNQIRLFSGSDFTKAEDIEPLLNRKGKIHVEWNKWNERLTDNFRFAVAFDSCTVETFDEGPSKNVFLTTRFSYRKNYTTAHATHIFNGLFEFHVYEGLFWYLQKEGWLHPFTAVWVANTNK